MSDRDPEDLLCELGVEPAGEDAFTGTLQDHGDGRVFGGELLAKAVAAAGRTSDATVHSVHACFLRAGRADRPLELRVERLRDGRRLAHRRVRLAQEGRQLGEYTISLLHGLDGAGYQDRDATRGVPGPDGLPTGQDLARLEGEPVHASPTEWRFVEVPWHVPEGPTDGTWRAWIRPTRPLPDDPNLHAAALAWLSDYGSVAVPQRRFGDRFDWDGSTSLDHSFWLHRTPRWEGYLLMESRSAIAHGGRSLTERTLWTPEGEHLASAMQEGLFVLLDGSRARA